MANSYKKNKERKLKMFDEGVKNQIEEICIKIVKKELSKSRKGNNIKNFIDDLEILLESDNPIWRQTASEKLEEINKIFLCSNKPSGNIQRGQRQDLLLEFLADGKSKNIIEITEYVYDENNKENVKRARTLCSRLKGKNVLVKTNSGFRLSSEYLK